jgi:BirA family transcriptional regulator, biotin operon repressor / biotin---[acetyl-CoA-carboxylase] ligase
MNIPLLRRLRETRGVFIPLAELGTDLGRVRGELDELEAFGFVLERHPYRGVAYRGPAGQFCPDQIEFELDTRRVGRRVAVWNRVTSTNDLAARASGSSANDGLVILAEEQSAGRGRRGRSWMAPAGSSLLMSVLLFPPATLATAGWLTALGAVGTAEVVAASTGRDARIKWPNDVRVDGRKIAGVLVERGPGAIIGIGLNANLARDDFPGALRESATSLRILLGEPVDRSELARALIRRLDHWYELGRSQGPETLAIPWRDRSEHLGRTVRVTTPSAELVGHLDDLDLLQGLTLTLPEGRRHHVPLRDLLALGPADTEPGDAVTPSRSGS